MLADYVEPLFEPLRTRIKNDGATAKSVFVAWEQLRVLYNFVLALTAAPMSIPVVTKTAFWEFLIVAVFMANVCFCAGPVVEGYLTAMGAQRRLSRWIIFTGGILIGCGATVLAMLSFLLKDFD